MADQADGRREDEATAKEGRVSERGRALLPWLAGGLALFTALAGAEALWLRPGLAAPGELGGFGRWIAPGIWLRSWFRFGGGAWTHLILAGILQCPWGWRSLYAYNVLALGLGFWGIGALGRKLGAPAAAAWALAFAWASPWTYAQSRMLDAYALLPGLVCVLAVQLRERPRNAWGAWVCGAVAALAALDSPVWPLAFPALYLAWRTAPAGERPEARTTAAGFGLGMAVLFALSWSFGRVQGGDFSAFGANAGAFFFGVPEGPSATGGAAAFPWPAWPGLIFGVWCAPSWLWVWAGVGLLGLAGPVPGPERAAVAWPALLLISGFGTVALCRRLKDSVALTLFAAFALAAPLWGYARMDAAISRWEGAVYGSSREIFEAADFLKERSQGRLVDLGIPLESSQRALLARRLREIGVPVSGEKGAERWWVIPASMADPEDATWGTWKVFRVGDGAPLYLLAPAEGIGPLMDLAARRLKPLFAAEALPPMERLEAFRQGAAAARDIWTWNAYAEAELRLAVDLGDVEERDVVPILNGRCLSSSALAEIRDALRDSQPRAADAAAAELAVLEAPGGRWKVARRMVSPDPKAP
jgi:hypothetical protein